MLQQNNKLKENFKQHQESHQIFSLLPEYHNIAYLNKKRLQQINDSGQFDEKQPHQKKRTQDEGFGFQQQDQQQILIVKKQNILGQTFSLSSKKFIPYRTKEPKLKLTFISKQKSPENLGNTLRKQYEIKSSEIKKSMASKSMILDPQTMIHNCVVKIKRNFVGDNITYHNHSLQQSKRIKFQIISTGCKIIYEIVRESSTYAHISLLRQKNILKNQINNSIGSHTNKPTLLPRNNSKRSKHQNDDIFISNSRQNQINSKASSCFIDSPLNLLLKTKLKQSFIYHKKRQSSKNNQQIQFDAEFQSGNLQFVGKVNSSASYNQANDKSHFQKPQYKQMNSLHEYNLFLRNDTNTHGHQNWFYFKVKNNSKATKRIKLNVVNLKRNLNLVKDGQKIYIRRTKPSKGQWELAGQNVDIKQNKNISIYRGKVRTLSFQLQIPSQVEYEVSLLPAYTYSELLQDVQKIKGKPHLKVQTLTYSLIGLAIPIITFTNFDSEQTNKEVILISSRIHPGQTVASFMVKGFINNLTTDHLSPEIQQFLNNTIIKIIPMINPDGVVFGNFRTNYLGYDLNRSFHSDDQITNPQVLAVKQLGRKLKMIHGDRFTTFIDLHGHSSQKNIFSYGPDFQNGHERFYRARLLPKLLNSNSCNFKLEEYKHNTARAFFLNTLNVIAFTIESSYAIYQTDQGKNQLLTQKQWLDFGKTLCSSFELMQKLNKTHSIKNRTQLKKAILLSQDQNIHLLNALKKQIKKQENNKKFKKVSIAQIQQEDSDGQDESQDLNTNQRQEVQKKLIENTVKNVVLPKVFKPSILYPTVTPKLFSIGQSNGGSYKILYTRRNRYQSIKMPANTYLHSLQGMENLKPKARNIKLDR